MSVKTLTLILTFTLSVCALAAPADIYKSLGLSEGKVTLIKDTDEHCSGGPFKFVGEKDQEVLMIGATLTFYQPTKEKEILAKADAENCAEDVVSRLSGKKLVMTTTIHSCPKKLKRLESVSEESIEVEKTTIKYLRKSKQEKTECVFQWVAK